jgi:hypothetical protein
MAEVLDNGVPTGYQHIIDITDILFYYIPITVSCLDTVDFANLI